MKQKKIRVLLAKAGLDGHDRGIKVLAYAFRDAGMEVIYTGLRQSVEAIVLAAVEEDVDVIGISTLSGSHINLFPEIIRLMNSYNIADIPFIAGGIIPAEDIPVLKQMGVKEVFPPETPTSEIVNFVKGLF